MGLRPGGASLGHVADLLLTSGGASPLISVRTAVLIRILPDIIVTPPPLPYVSLALLTIHLIYLVTLCLWHDSALALFK